MLPRNLRPMRLSRRSEPFDSADFIYELKIDGFRALVHIGNGRGELISRNGNVFRGFASSLFAQTPADQQRIVEPIIVNGQEVQGVLVLQNGAVQSYTCSSPQPYTTANRSENGWACFDQATDMWLLHAQPPIQVTAPSPQPTIVYSQPNPVYVPAPVYGYSYYPYPDYPYPYSHYSYPYFVGPRFSFGFGFGFGFGFRSPVIVNRPVLIGRPIAPFVASRPFGGGFGRPRVGFGRAGGGFARVGRR